MNKIVSSDFDSWSLKNKSFHQCDIFGRADTGVAIHRIAIIFLRTCSNPATQGHSTLINTAVRSQGSHKVGKHFLFFCLTKNFLATSTATWHWALHRARWVHAAILNLISSRFFQYYMPTQLASLPSEYFLPFRYVS